MRRDGTRSLASVPAGMVFDPLLPEETLARLRAGEGALIIARPGTRPGSYRFRRQRLVVGAVVFCCAAAVVALVQRTGGTGWASAAGIAAAFAYVPVNAADRRATALHSAGVVCCFLGIWAVWAIAMAEAFGSVTVPLGILHGFALAVFIACGGRGTTHVVGRDRVIDPRGLASAERARLADVRYARDRVVRLREPVLDPVLAALHEIEWAVAARPREPGSSDDGRLAVFLERVEGAVRAHREWERRPRVSRGTGAPSGFAGHPDLTGDVGLAAVRRAREELTAEAVKSGERLLTVLRGTAPSGG